MNTIERESLAGDDAVEAILKKGGRRPAPPAGDEQAIRHAVRGEWQKVIRRRRLGRRVMRLGLAAGIAATAVLIYTLMPKAGVAPEAIASIDRSTGTIYLLAPHAELVDFAGASEIYPGQVIQTGADGSLGIAWRGSGSLRIDRDTRIEFVDETSVFLHRGRIYFASDPAGTDARLVVETDHGTVTHLGTQFLAGADTDQLVVSVREGSVRIDGRFHERLAGPGKQVRIRGSARPEVVDVAPYGELWAWTEALAPAIRLDDRSAYDFLEWVGRETGYDIVFVDDDAESLARDTTLVGTVEAEPRTELRLRMMTTDLAYAFEPDDGTIHVRLAGTRGD